MTKSMEELLDFDPVSWGSKEEPLEAGDSLIGEVVEISRGESVFGPYPIVGVIDAEGGQWSWHAFHTVAKNELANQRPQPGDKIGVRYLGKAHPDDPQSYVRFRVVVQRATGAHGHPESIDWDKVSADAASEMVGMDEEVPHPAETA